jgi:cold shock CspA family protein
MYQLKTEVEKLKKLGVYVAIKVRDPKDKDKKNLAQLGGGESVPESDGLFASGENPKAFAIVVIVPAKGNIAVAVPNGSKGEELMVLNPTQNDPETYVRLVSTYEVLGGRSTKPEDNSVTIVSTKNGLLQVFSVGVVTRIQDNIALHFLVVQEMYRAKLYRNPITGEVAVCDEEYDGYKKWPALQKIVEMTAGEKLPALPKVKPAKQGDMANLPNGQAEVLFFDVRKGFGFAKTNEGPRYFHWRQSDTNDRLPYFDKGELVSYSGLLETSRGVQLLGVKTVA